MSDILRKYAKFVDSRVSKPDDGVIGRISATNTIRSLHGALGIQSEAGELADVFKRHIFYGTPVDEVNVKEELGDLMFYIQEFCLAHGYDLENVLAANVAKLEARYPNGFDANRAVDRDLDVERVALEG